MNNGFDDPPFNRKTRSKKGPVNDFPPSDQRFDRSLLSSDEYIEMLLFENRELQTIIAHQEEEMASLHATITNMDKLHSNPDDGSSNVGILNKTKIVGDGFRYNAVSHDNKILSKGSEEEASMPRSKCDIPERSSRRTHISKVDLTEPKLNSKLSNSSLNCTSNTPPEQHLSELQIDSQQLLSVPSLSGLDSTSPSGNKSGEVAHTNDYETTKSVKNNESKAINNSGMEQSLNEYRPSGFASQHSLDSKGYGASPNSTPIGSYKPRIRLPSTLHHQLNSTRNVSSSEFNESPENSEGYELNNSQRPADSIVRSGIAPPVDTSKRLPPSPNLEDDNVLGKLNCSNNQLQRSQDSLPYGLSPSQKSTNYGNSDVDLDLDQSNEYFSADPLHSNKSTPSFQVLKNPRPEDDESGLVVKPDEFQTINISISSTIHFSNTSIPVKDPNFTLSVIDRKSDKEMWRVRKTYSSLAGLNNEISPLVEYFGLPQVPEKSFFLSSSPSKIDIRRMALQSYFNSFFLMPHISHTVLIKICRYLSSDIVNPLDDYKSGSRMEGFLVRRYKGLGSSWRVRWCQLEGPFLQIFEGPGGQFLENIQLKGTQIGKQTNDSVADDRGYRHAFLIMDPQKSKLSSSVQKYFFCAETDEDRDQWVDALFENHEEENPIDVQNSSFNSIDQKQEDESSEIGINGRHTSGLGIMNVKINNTSEQDSSSSVVASNDVKDQKEIKKLRKRSIFPFRKQSNSVSEHDDDQTANTQQDSDVQSYLNGLKLSEDLTKSIFGRELDEAFYLSNHILFGHSIPSICCRCLDFLMKTGAVYEEGIFRLSGSASVIRQLKDQFNTKFDLDLFECNLQPDMHTVSGLLKTYLRELPTPMVGKTALDDLNNIAINGASVISPSMIASKFKEYFNNNANVPKINYDLCYVIFKFLRLVISKNQVNRMNLRNVCIVFVPTLNISLEVLSTFLVDFEYIFENSSSPIPNNEREVLDLHIPVF